MGGALRQVWSVAGPLLLVFFTLGFVLHSGGRGLSLGSAHEQMNSRLFHGADAFGSVAIYGHMVAGAALTLLAPLQLIGAWRRRVPRLHHTLGYLIAAAALLTAMGGLIYIAAHGTIGGPLMSAGFATYGVLVALAAVQTIRFARRRDVRHHNWAARLVVLALGSWLYRVHYGIWEITTGGLWSQPDFRGGFDLAQNVMFYLPYLIALEFWLRARRGRVVAGLK